MLLIKSNISLKEDLQKQSRPQTTACSKDGVNLFIENYFLEMFLEQVNNRFVYLQGMHFIRGWEIAAQKYLNSKFLG